MGLFNTILQKLGFMKDKAVEAVAGETAAAAEAPAAADAPAAAPETVDVVAVCEALAAKNPQKLNWRTSIVDLMKLLGMDSSLANRKEFLCSRVSIIQGYLLI